MSDEVFGFPYNDYPPLMGEIMPDPLEAVRASVPERRGNLIYHTIELHSGPRSRTIARFCQVYRQATGDYHHTSVELFHFGRPNQHIDFTLDRKFALDGAALENFVAGSRAIPRLETIQLAATSLIVPMSGAGRDLTNIDADTVVNSLSLLLGTEAGRQAIAGGSVTREALDNIDAAVQQARYRRATDELRTMLGNPELDEQAYQTWFEQHPWVFGTEYLGRIPARNIDIESKVDIVLLSADGFVDVFELKKPTEPLLAGPSRHTYYAAAPVSQALSQAIHYLRLMNENRLRLEEAWGKQVFRPRAIIVIGRSNQWNEAQHEAWRNLRTTLQNIDLLTFDHVLTRANRLIAQYQLPVSEP